MKPGIERVILLLFSLFIFSPFAFSQQKPAAWNLQACINYALQNNIQIKKMQVGVRNSEINYDEAKAAVLPGLNGTVSQAFTNQAAVQGSGTNQSQSYTGNYALRSDMILYQDHKLQNTISQQELNVKSGLLNVKESENSIELAVTTAYLQILYARESVINAENSLKSSEAQLEQAKIHFDAGYIAESNYAQVQAQLSSDKYALVVANNNLNQQILTLKQLLELDIRYELDIVYPDLSDSQVLKLIPGKEQVYKTALEFMPEVANSQLSIRIADLDIQIAECQCFNRNQHRFEQ